MTNGPPSMLDSLSQTSGGPRAGGPVRLNARSSPCGADPVISPSQPSRAGIADVAPEGHAPAFSIGGPFEAARPRARGACDDAIPSTDMPILKVA